MWRRMPLSGWALHFMALTTNNGAAGMARISRGSLNRGIGIQLFALGVQSTAEAHCWQ